MPSSATVTGKTGPGSSVTSLALANVRSVLFGVGPAGPQSVLKITLNDGSVKDFDLAATTTVTATISAGILAVTISQ